MASPRPQVLRRSKSGHDGAVIGRALCVETKGSKRSLGTAINEYFKGASMWRFNSLNGTIVDWEIIFVFKVRGDSH